MLMHAINALPPNLIGICTPQFGAGERFVSVGKPQTVGLQGSPYDDLDLEGAYQCTNIIMQPGDRLYVLRCHA
jgi:hypothetical protein